MKTKYTLYVVIWLLILLILSSDSFSYYSTRRLTKDIFLSFSPDAPIRMILKFHEIMRKTLHVLNYAFLSWLLLCAFAKSFRPISRWTPKLAMFCIIFCVLYSASDEWRQSFSDVRTSSLLDVFLDTGGAVLMQIVCWIIVRLKFRGSSVSGKIS